MLARLLVEQPDLLLLDEPTNHLDLDAVEWLEKYLQGYPNAALIVSHDRYFLDRVTETTWEVAFGSLESYSGGYSEYLKKREQRFDERMKRYQAQQEYIAKTEEFIRRNLSGQRTKEAQGRRTRLERFIKTEAMARPRRHETINIHLQPETRSGDLVLRATGLQAGYQPDTPIVSAERLELRRGRKLAVVGGNGTGKTTLLRTLLGQLTPLAGQMELGANVTCGYLSQTHENLQSQSTVLEAMTGATGLKPQEARSLLGSFHLSGDDALKKVSELSGGQRSRVILAQLSALRANLLMLDEPTNHLDLPSREVLQEALLNYRGTVIFVSHDRYLVQAVASDLWAVEDGRVHRIHGQWEQYLRWRSDHRAGQASTSPERARKQHTRKEDRRQQRRQQKERRRAERQMEKLEADIEQIENRVAELSDEISRAGQAGDLDAVHRLGEEFEKVQSALTESMDAWSRLGEQLDQG
jgi:ATP-binding cassette subfamily F protein 3